MLDLSKNRPPYPSTSWSHHSALADTMPHAPVRFIDCHPRQEDFRAAVLAGLGSTPKALEPKFFYDETGAGLFERICELPEYYPTRTEMAILEQYADEIRAAVAHGDEVMLIEFGSGAGKKVRLLLDHLRPAGYVAIDISKEQLVEACSELAQLYPQIGITAVYADYSQSFVQLASEIDGSARRLAFFPGSTIGNFTPGDAISFLRNVRSLVGAGGGLLIGVDMKKDRALLHAAYNDSAGVTAAFNFNLLHRINRELHADFDVSRFEHHAFYNEEQGRVEMHLRSLCAQHVRIGQGEFSFAGGETIHTENSYKYTPDEFAALAERAGFVVNRQWRDDDGLFGVFYLAGL